MLRLDPKIAAAVDKAAVDKDACRVYAVGAYAAWLLGEGPEAKPSLFFEHEHYAVRNAEYERFNGLAQRDSGHTITYHSLAVDLYNRRVFRAADAVETLTHTVGTVSQTTKREWRSNTEWIADAKAFAAVSPGEHTLTDGGGHVIERWTVKPQSVRFFGYEDIPFTDDPLRALATACKRPGATNVLVVNGEEQWYPHTFFTGSAWPTAWSDEQIAAVGKANGLGTLWIMESGKRFFAKRFFVQGNASFAETFAASGETAAFRARTPGGALLTFSPPGVQWIVANVNPLPFTAPADADQATLAKAAGLCIKRLA